MPDLSRVITGFADIGGMVWSGSTLYFTADGALRFVNPMTGAMGGVTLPDARNLRDLDISRDGAFAIVTDGLGRTSNGVSEGIYYRVTLATGQVETFKFVRGENGYETGPIDVAILSDGRALLTTDFAGSGTTDLRILRATDASPVVQVLSNGEVGAPAILDVSESHRYVLIGESRTSSGPFELFDATTGVLTRARLSQFPGHIFSDFIVNVDIHEATGRIAVAARDGALVITDLSMTLVKDLTFDFDLRTQGVQFTPDGSKLLVTQSASNLIAVFDTGTWAQIGSYRLQSRLTDEPYSHDGSMAVSPDGRFLFVDTSTGIEVVDLSAQGLTSDGGVGMPRFQIVEPFVLAAGETVARETLGYTLISKQPGPLTIFSIAGAVNVTGDYALGVVAQAGDWKQRFVIELTGALRVTSATGEAKAYSVGGFDGASFTNHGQLVVTAPKGSATGVESYALKGEYLNTGTIRVTGGQGATGLALVNLTAPSGFRNQGSIEVRDSGHNSSSSGVVLSSVATSFRNDAGASIIVAHDGASIARNIAVYLEADGFFRPQGDAYFNAGLIQGDYALYFTQRSDSVDIAYQRIFHNEATGVMRGEVYMSGNGLTLDNAGLVDGPVNFGEWSEFYDGSRGGRVTGMVSGGAGGDQMIGGPGFDNFQGNTGNDDLKGGGGDDWVVGGKDNDQLSGDAGSDLVYGNLGNDTCDGGDGDDIVRGGQDNDVLRGAAGNDYLSGDKGEDTIAGGTGADIFHTFGEAGMDRVVDFNLAEGDRVLLDSGTAYTVAQVGADTVISMTGGGQMVLIGVQMSSLTPGWILGA